jgi:hypothetical protein
MKAQFVYESLDFERGRDPKEAMGIGREAILNDIWGAILSSTSSLSGISDRIPISYEEYQGLYILIADFPDSNDDDSYGYLSFIVDPKDYSNHMRWGLGNDLSYIKRETKETIKRHRPYQFKNI